jgi:hypothetical protein
MKWAFNALWLLSILTALGVAVYSIVFTPVVPHSIGFDGDGFTGIVVIDGVVSVFRGNRIVASVMLPWVSAGLIVLPLIWAGLALRQERRRKARRFPVIATVQIPGRLRP